MILPTVTWGELRETYREYLEAPEGTFIEDNLLNSESMMDRSEGKADDEYVWPEEAAQFKETFDNLDAKTLTAAGEPVEGEEEFPTPLYFTVDDTGNVLELVKMEDTGLFIRMERKWVDISDEDEFPTVYEQDMHFANDESVPAWDAELEEKDDLKLEDIQDYLVQ